MTMDVEGRKICLSHSYYKKGLENLKYKDMSYQDVWNIVWTSIYRDDFETKGENIYGDYDYTFATGHVPVQRIRKWIEVEEDFGCLKSFRKGNLIDIDGGCSFGEIDEVDNGLIFLRLEDMVEFPVPYVG
jgi:serine/threonine protein phosphatase 1